MLVSDLIEETRRRLLTGQREERNKLNAAITNVATTLTATYAMRGIQLGAKLSIDLEDMYVWSISSQTATVDRGQFGSTAASHLINSTIYVNSKFTPWEIFKAINEEIVALSAAGLYRPVTTELTYNAAISGYNYATTNVLGILDVRYSTPGTSGEYLRSTDYELVRNLSDEYAAGSAIMVRDAFPGRTVLVTAKAPFVQLAASLSADLTTTFVPTTALDILSIGAAWRLTLPREVRRNFDEVQGDTRRADEVPPGSQLGGSRELGRLRDIRIKEEVARLTQAHPYRKSRYPYAASY